MQNFYDIVSTASCVGLQSETECTLRPLKARFIRMKAEWHHDVGLKVQVVMPESIEFCLQPRDRKWWKGTLHNLCSKLA